MIYSQAHSLESFMLSCLRQEILFTSDRGLEMPSSQPAGEMMKEVRRRSKKRRKQQLTPIKTKAKTKTKTNTTKTPLKKQPRQ